MVWSIVLSSLLLVVCSSGAWAAVHGPQTVSQTPLASGTKFASPTGSGTTCTQAAPCSLSTVIGQATAGAVVFLRGGTYNITSNIFFSGNGTAAQPITFESYPGETATLYGGNLAEGTQVFIRVTGNYNVLRRIVISTMPCQGLVVRGNHNLFDGLWVHHNKISGIHIHDGTYTTPYGAMASFNTIQNTTVNDNSDTGLGNGGNADGISISSGTGNEVLYSLAEHNSDDGFDAWRSQNTHFAYNVSTNNGIESGNGMGFKAGGAAPSQGTRVDHNLSYNNRGAGFDTNSGKDVQFDNNTAWDNDDEGFVMCTGAAACVSMPGAARNNISLANSAHVSGTGTTINNSWQRGGTPAFISTTYGSTDFLRPTTGGGFTDIGAYAATGADTIPPTTPTSVSLTVNGPNGVTVSYGASTDATGVAGYNIRRCTGASCTPTTILTTVGNGTLSVVDTGLTASTVYGYSVNAFDYATPPNQSAYTTTTYATTASNYREILGYDLFNRADGLLGSEWDDGYTDQSEFALVSNQLRVTDVALNSLEKYNAIVAPNDQWCQVTIARYDGSGVRAPGCDLRLTNPPTQTTYSFRAQGVGSDIREITAGSGAILVSESTSTWQAGDKLRGEAEGTALRLYQIRNGAETLLLSTTDATIASGQPGIVIFVAAGTTADVQIDDFVTGGFSGTPPVPPKMLTGDADSSGADLTWSGPPVYIRVATNQSSVVEPIASFPGGRYTRTWVVGDTTVSFFARDAVGTENQTDIVTLSLVGIAPSADTTPPVMSDGQPTATLPAGTTSTTISMTTDNPATDTCRWAATDMEYAVMPNAMTGGPGLRFSGTLSGLTDNSSTLSYVRCVDLADNANTSSLVITTTVAAAPSDTTPPSTVTNVVATAIGPRQIQVDWTAATDASGIREYHVFLCEGVGCSTFALATLPVTETTTILSVNPSTWYSTVVRAVDNVGNPSAADSNVSTVQTPPETDITPPSTISGLTATSRFTESVQLSWTPATDDSGAPVTTVFERCSGAGCSSWEVVANITANVSTFYMTGLSPGTSYSFRAKAVDVAGNSSLAYSNTATAETLASTPRALAQPRAQATPRGAAERVGGTGYVLAETGDRITIEAGGGSILIEASPAGRQPRE